MRQYYEYTNRSFQYVIDQYGRHLRVGVRNNKFVVDAELTANGFSGVENIGWVNVRKSNYEILGNKFREGIRNNEYKVDAERTYLGFNGIAGIDWEEVGFLDNYLNDGHTLAYYDAFDLRTITKNSSNVVTQWKDKLQNLNRTLTGTAHWHPRDGMIFNIYAANEYLRTETNAWTTGQPFYVYMLVKIDEWNSNGYLIDGRTSPFSPCMLIMLTDNYGFLKIGGSSPNNIFKNIHNITSWGIIRYYLNGENSFFKPDHQIFSGANCGYGVDGITLGQRYDLDYNYYAKYRLKGLILRDSDANETEIYNCLLKSFQRDNFGTGKVVFTWDGNLKGIKDGIDILDSYNKKSTVWVLADNTYGGVSGNFTFSQVSQWLANGHDIQSHSYNHTRVTNQSEAEFKAMLEQCNAIHIANGWGAIKHFAYPYGSNRPEYHNWASEYILSARGIRENMIWSRTYVDPYDLPAIETDGVKTVNEVKAILDLVKQNRKAVILYAHNVKNEEGYLTPSMLAEYIEYAESIGLEIITYDQLYNLLKLTD